jgi:N utilization substance protein A
MAVSANRLELLQIADAVAREKSIDRQIVLSSMEDAMQKAARSRYGQETEVRAEINPKTGEVRFSRLLLVVDDVENDATQIHLADARKKNPAAQVGDWIAETLPPFDFGRIAAQSAKQVIVQKVREAERDRQYEEYRDRIGEIVNGAKCSGRATASAPMSTMSGANSVGHRFSCRGPIRSSWPNCSCRKCRKSTTASSK